MYSNVITAIDKIHMYLLCFQHQECYIFIIFGHQTNLSLLIFLSRSNSLSHANYIRLPLSYLLSHITPNLWSTSVLSSGWLLIALSEWWLLSCMIHWPTKQCYYRLGLRPLALVALPAQSRLQVYKMYHYPTWTWSLSFHTIETSEPEPWRAA